MTHELTLVCIRENLFVPRPPGFSHMISQLTASTTPQPRTKQTPSNQKNKNNNHKQTDKTSRKVNKHLNIISKPEPVQMNRKKYELNVLLPPNE